MRRSPLFLLLAICFSVSASARSLTTVPHPDEPNAILRDSFSVSITVTDGASGQHPKVEQAAMNIFVWAIGSGRIDYVMDVRSLQFSGDSLLADTISTVSLFSLFAQATIAQGIGLGYTFCTPSCGNPTMAYVYQSPCVQRSGSGLQTHFIPCDTQTLEYRVYTTCCPDGVTAPSITAVQHPWPICAGGTTGCESTCP